MTGILSNAPFVGHGICSECGAEIETYNGTEPTLCEDCREFRMEMVAEDSYYGDRL
jgi:predicted amidophosphoribosyltransferase